MWVRRKRGKFGNRKVTVQGLKFDSILEHTVYQMLRLQEMKGEIKILQLQAKVHLTEAAILMIPDFKCQDRQTDEIYYVEAKGFETAVYRLKRKLWLKYGPGRMDVWMGTKKGIYLKESLLKGVEPVISSVTR